MFPKKLIHSPYNKISNDFESDSHLFEISDTGYGKDNVKILHISRDGPVHTIKEFEVSSHLKLSTKRDYTHGDNEKVIATDSQKNTIYLLAKKFGMKSPEEFALILINHFLEKYPHVAEAHIHIQEYPWTRLKYNKEHERKHNHAFLYNPNAVRYCDVLKKRNEKHPTIISGFRNIRVLKTTQSSFVNFVDDEYRSLPDMADRVLSTNISAYWQYSIIDRLNFDAVWEAVREIVLRSFAGNCEYGIQSPSVQHTIYLAEREVLRAVPQISVINMEMPNIHYFPFDVSKHPKLFNETENKEVFLPVDKPSGIIYAQLRRSDIASKL